MQRRRRRGGLRAAEQQELWQRWRHGQSLSEIARALDRRPTVVRRVGIVNLTGPASHWGE